MMWPTTSQCATVAEICFTESITASAGVSATRTISFPLAYQKRLTAKEPIAYRTGGVSLMEILGFSLYFLFFEACTFAAYRLEL